MFPGWVMALLGEPLGQVTLELLPVEINFQYTEEVKEEGAVAEGFLLQEGAPLTLAVAPEEVHLAVVLNCARGRTWGVSAEVKKDNILGYAEVEVSTVLCFFVI